MDMISVPTHVYSHLGQPAVEIETGLPVGEVVYKNDPVHCTKKIVIKDKMFHNLLAFANIFLYFCFNGQWCAGRTFACLVAIIDFARDVGIKPICCHSSLACV
jgi:hypothetical protein